MSGLRRRVSILPVSWVAPMAGCKLNSDGCARGNPGTSGGGVWFVIVKGSYTLATPVSLVL